MQLPDAIKERIKQRRDLWREICVMSLELLEGSDKHVDRVLALYRRQGEVTAQEWRDAANAAAYAAHAAANAAHAAHAAAYAAYAAYAANAANAAANAAYNAANAANAAEPAKARRFIAALFLLLECSGDKIMASA